MSVQHVPFEDIQKKLWELGAAYQKKVYDLTNTCHNQGIKLRELEQAKDQYEGMLEQKRESEADLRKTQEAMLKKHEEEAERINEAHATLMSKTRGQFVLAIKRCPPICIRVRLAHPQYLKIPALEQQSVPSTAENAEWRKHFIGRDDFMEQGIKSGVIRDVPPEVSGGLDKVEAGLDALQNGVSGKEIVIRSSA
ncbi:hypothetical protein N0V95_005799 [Ascochyta clinopodiicola]|nr:hypothetical protein N0V95_005799 [Ascochyta clinopodiicola]